MGEYIVLVLKRLIGTAGLAALVGIAACSDAVGPDDVDPSAMANSLTNATATFDNNAAFQSMATLSFLFPQYAAVSALRASLPAAPADAGPLAVNRTRARAEAVRAYWSLRGSNNPQALFPSNVLGKTLEWDAATHTYIIGNQAGGPVAGIRILLYTVSGATGEPIVPLQSLGYVDLTDESNPALDQLGVLLKLGTSTIANYAVTLVEGTQITTLEAQGFIRNAQGTAQVDFDFIDESNNAAQTYVSTSELAGDDGGKIFVTVSISSTTVGLIARVQSGDNKLEINVTVDEVSGALAGTVKYNSVVVANVSGDVDGPVFTAVSGRTLSAAETAALLSIFEKAIEVATELGSAVYSPGIVVFSN